MISPSHPSRQRRLARRDPRAARAAVAPVAAKEGIEARLDAPIRRHARPARRSTSAGRSFIDGDGDEAPMHGMPVFVRLLPRAAASP